MNITGSTILTFPFSIHEPNISLLQPTTQAGNLRLHLDLRTPTLDSLQVKGFIRKK